MADRYITSAYVSRFIGTAVVNALLGDSAQSSTNVLNTLIEAATASVQPAMRNSGYAVAADSDGTATTDETVKLAVMGALWILIAGRSEYGIALPEQWSEHPANVARKQILNGDAQLSISKTARDAVGGVKFTDGSTNSTTGHPQRSSRTNLAGY